MTKAQELVAESKPIYDKGLQELEHWCKDLDELDKRNRIPPTKLYCLNCGQVINDHYQGECYSYTHLCGKDNYCTCLTLEDHPLVNASFFSNMSYKNCKECKTKEEHAEKLIQSYLGKSYKDFEPKNLKVLKHKLEFINYLKDKVALDDPTAPDIFDKRREERRVRR